MSNDDHDSDDTPEDRSAWLATLRRLLESLDNRPETDRDEPYDVAYGLSIRTGLEPTGERRGRRPRAHPRTTDSQSPPDSAHHVTTRRYRDELLVIVDVPDVDPGAITAGVIGEHLVVAVDGTEVGRVEIPWPQHDAEARINNDVLTIAVRAPDAASDDRHRPGETQNGGDG